MRDSCSVAWHGVSAGCLVAWKESKRVVPSRNSASGESSCITFSMRATSSWCVVGKLGDTDEVRVGG